MKTLILVTGKARSGKDTVAKRVMEDLNSAQCLDITGHLKEKVQQLFGMSSLDMEDYKDDECVEFNGNKYTVRHFLQFIGNDIAPGVLGKYHWCMERQEAMFSVDREINILCGVRQLKEVEYFKRNNPDKRVMVLKVRRMENGEDYSPIINKAHSTETEVDLIDPDFLIEAENGDFAGLEQQIVKFIDEIL